MVTLFRRPAPLLLLAIFAVGCDSTGPTDSFGIVGSSPTVVAGMTHQFTLASDFAPGVSVLWSLPDGINSGSIDSTGFFTAGITPGTWKVAATAEDDPTVTDTATVKVVGYATVTNFTNSAYAVDVNSNGVIASANCFNKVTFTSTLGIIPVTVDGSPCGIAFAPGGTSVVVNSIGGHIYRIATATGAVMDTLSINRFGYNIAVRPTNGVVYATTDDGWLLKIAPAPLALLDSVKLASASNGIAFAPGGNTLWVSTIGAGILYRLDPATLAKVDSFMAPGELQRVVVAPSGDSVYVADQTQDLVHVIRPSTHTMTSFAVPFFPHGVGLSSDGSKLYVAQVEGERVSVFDRATLTLLGMVKVGGTPRALAPIPGTKSMMVTTELDLVRLN